MRRFAQLYADLDGSSGTLARVAALQSFFAASDPRDGAWPGPGWGRGPGMGMGAGTGWGMPGFGTSLDALRTAPDFDRAFLEQMIAHHRMGVMMASHAQWGSNHPELRELEQAMVRAQSNEIDQMARWYRQWYGSSAQ